MQFEFSFGGKWLELLKQIAPGVTRVAVFRDAAISAGVGQFGVSSPWRRRSAWRSIPVNVRDAAEIERAVTDFARAGNGGLIVTGGPWRVFHRDLIVTLAARHKLPAVYFARSLVTAGGLISYGPDFIDQYRQAAGYVDRILKGEKPADLPVQAPTKYEPVINLKTAKALGLTVPPIPARPRRRGDRIGHHLLRRIWSLMAQSGHRDLTAECPLSGVKRTWPNRAAMSAFDPKRTSGHCFRQAVFRARLVPLRCRISDQGAGMKRRAVHYACRRGSGECVAARGSRATGPAGGWLSWRHFARRLRGRSAGALQAGSQRGRL